MNYLRVMRIFSLAAMFSLVTGVAFAERSFAQAMVEITAADLTATTGATTKSAQDKVNEKINAATLTGGSVVSFPSGEFKDVGEIQVFGKSGTAPSGSGATAVAAKYVTLRGSGTVFTGKIMINVQDSEYIVIEGFTFRDTQAPDEVTVTPGASTGATDETATRVENTGVVWLNTAVAAATAECSTDAAMKPLTNITVRDNVFMNTARHGVLARAKDALGDLAPPGFHVKCDSSAVTISGNSFVGIGLGPNAAYLDSAKTIPGNKNWKNAIEGQKAYGWTVRNNYIGAERDGTEAAGTTFFGIKIDNAFGKTLVENNVVNGTASSGIVVGGSASSADATAAAAAEITIRNNRVTNSRNDAWFAQFWADGFDNDGDPTNGYIGPWTPGAGMLVASYSNTGMTDKQADELLMPRIYALPTGFTAPFLGASGSRAVSSIVTTYDDNTGNRENSAGDRNTGDVSPIDSSPGTGDNIPERAVVRNLKPGIEAGIELNRLTAKTILVENNELTGNVVGLVVCPSWYCYADHDFQSLLDADQTPAAGTLKVPTVRNNRIYDNDKATDMPRSLVLADVINALTEANTGTGKNVLVLAGNYLGDSPEVEGAANTDDLATAAPENVGPRETDDPGLAATGGAALSGTAITLTYDEALDDDSVPAAAAFTVTETDSGGLSRSVTVSGVAVSGMSVTLTLANAPGSGNSVTVSYDPTKAGSGGPIRDVAGNEAPALTSRAVTASTPTTDPDPDPTPMPQPAATDDGGCALASGGGGGTDLGRLLPLMLAVFVFGLGRNAGKRN